jgi:hypothetical protein
MALTRKTETGFVFDLTIVQEQKIIDFLQGAVYCWCKNKPDEYFSIIDLVGIDINYWKGTPLIELYQKYILKGIDIESAVKGSGIDSGYLLEKMLVNDKRLYDIKEENLLRKYCWIKDDVYKK